LALFRRSGLRYLAGDRRVTLRKEGLSRVAPSHAGKTVLTAQQIEDVVAFLSTLK
jgi:hypothetical protein